MTKQVSDAASDTLEAETAMDELKELVQKVGFTLGAVSDVARAVVGRENARIDQLQGPS